MSKRDFCRGLTDDSLCSRLLQHIRCLGKFQYIDLNSTPSPYPHHDNYPCHEVAHLAEGAARVRHVVQQDTDSVLHIAHLVHICARLLKQHQSRCHGQSCFAISKFIPLVRKRQYLFVRTLIAVKSKQFKRLTKIILLISPALTLSLCISAKSRLSLEARPAHLAPGVHHHNQQQPGFLIMIMVVRYLLSPIPINRSGFYGG